MEEKIIIYAVNSGTYSGYSIDALFESKDLAEAYMKTFPLNHDVYNELEEFTLNPYLQQLRKGYSPFEVRMDKDGNVTDTSIVEYSFQYKYINDIHFDNNILRMYILASDEKHAIKIVNEKRLQLIAENNWSPKRGQF